MTKLEPFGTIRACPACGARETWGDGLTYVTYQYPVREFERQYIVIGQVSSACWRCSYLWREVALHLVEENDEDQANQQ